MTILATCLVAFLLLIYFISVIQTTRTKNLNEHIEHEKKLLSNIELASKELSDLRESKRNATIDKSVNLTSVVTNVLDIYEESNIQIPVEIIEQMSFMNLYNETEVFHFIENQRNYWKLENTKKPYRKV